jgi:hypothetical protein
MSHLLTMYVWNNLPKVPSYTGLGFGQIRHTHACVSHGGFQMRPNRHTGPELDLKKLMAGILYPGPQTL